MSPHATRPIAQVESVEQPWDKEKDNGDVNATLNSNLVTLDIHGSIFGRKWATEAVYPLAEMSYKQLEEFLAVRSKVQIKDKESNVLFCPSVFDPGKSGETSRGKENFVIASGIWLDFDGGDLLPDNLAALFPEVRMTIYNTYSSTGECLRFRGYIPTDALLTYDAYTGIARQIGKEIEAAGFVSMDKDGPKHGIDEGKLHPVSLFYLPCRPKDPSGAYFRTFSNKERKLLNVEEWLKRLEPEEEIGGFVDTGLVFPRRRNQTKINEAIEHWRASQTQSGVGHDEFWRLAFCLKAYGCEEHEIESILREQAEHAWNPKERRDSWDYEMPEEEVCLLIAGGQAFEAGLRRVSIPSELGELLFLKN